MTLINGDPQMARIFTATLAAAFLSANVLAQPIEAKLDHVIIGVHDMEAAKRVYSVLGFAIIPGGRHPGGTQNASPAFSGGGYLELITPYDASLPDGRDLSEILKKGDGPLGAGLSIASAEQAAHDLSTAGIKIKGPTPGTITREDDKEPPPTRWWILEFGDPASKASGPLRPEVASRPLFLIQYVRDPAHPRPPIPPNPNSASALSAILVAVNDLEKAAAGYANIGKLNSREMELPEFGAVAKEIVLARGSILLLRATDPSGPTAQRLKARGEGLFGVRLAVTDLDQARKAISEKNISTDEQTVLVPPENAEGAWLQFQRP
jgi:hypothetical protein